MKLLNIVKKLGLGIYASIKRFPMTLAFSTSVAIMLIIMSELSPTLSSDTMENLTRISMTLALGIPLSLCARVFYERSKEQNSLKLIIYYAISAIIPVLYYLFFLRDLNMVTITRMIGVNIAFYLCFIFIPYILTKENFEMYVINLFTSFLITYVYSAVLFAGLAAILFAIDSLLGIKIKSETYYYTFLMVALVFAPAYFLAYVPRQEKKTLSLEYSKILRILLLYIVMPLLTVYTIILYLYFGKILLSMEWPEGLVSHLVLWFSLILTVVLFFISPIKDNTTWTAKFSRWAPPIVLPILVMMFVSMGIRINAYGVTENRYYVMLLGLWIFGTMIYLSVVRNRKNIFLLISLSIVVFLSVVGPVNSYSISKYSQSNQLENLLAQNNMLTNGEIQPPPSTISKEDKESISSILSYFDNNHSLELDVLPSDFEMAQMDKVFGFSYEFPKAPYNDTYFHYMGDMDSTMIEISEYDYLIDNRGMYGNPPAEMDLLQINFTQETNIVTLRYDNEEIYERDLSDFALELHKEYGFSQKENSITTEDMTLVEENDQVKLKFVFQNIGGSKEEDGNIRINELFYYLLIKLK